MKTVRLKDIACIIGCSNHTVSAVLNNRPNCRISEARRKEVRRVAIELGYSPDLMARHLRGGSTKTIGIISSLGIMDVHTMLIRKLNELLTEEGYYCLLTNCFGQKANQESIVKDYLSRGVDGIILCSKSFIEPPDDICFININADNPECDIRIDRISGAYQLTEHLIRQHGHDKVGFVTTATSSNIGKYHGYRKALEDNGCGFFPEMTVEYHGGGTPKQILELINRGVKAWICSNDHLAIHLINLLTLKGFKVPEDVAVIGFDDSPKAKYVLPGLTTMAQPIQQLARMTVDELKSRLARKPPSPPVNLDCRMILRRSCGCQGETDDYWLNIDCTEL